MTENLLNGILILLIIGISIPVVYVFCRAIKDLVSCLIEEIKIGRFRKDMNRFLEDIEEDRIPHD